MKLSDAIRLGSMMKPQGFVSMLNGGRSCALGAAMDAIGRLNGFTVTDMAADSWPFLNDKVGLPCGCDSTDWAWKDVITHLNDSHEWTREAIADWVQTIEDAQPVLQPAEAAVMA